MKAKGRRPVKKLLIPVVLVASTISILSYAHDVRSPNQSSDPCEGLTYATDTLACRREELAIADQTLNLVYKKLFANLDAEEKKLMTKGQKGWPDLRDSDCAIYARVNEVEIQSKTIEAACKTRVTKERTQALRDLAEAFGVDLTS